MELKLPKQGFIFYPVGTGDSSTVAIDDDVIMQIDINHLSSSEDEDDCHFPIVDALVAVLPKKDGNPYLSVFALTHPDEDHCRGFADLNKKVTIGELWFTPRIFQEYKKDLCDDAKAFYNEAKRRVKKVINEKGHVESGDRVRIIGYDDLLEEDEFSGFPEELLTIPGNEITEIDGEECNNIFRAFVHAPFKEDSESDRNDTSLALQITLYNENYSAEALFFGDHCYPTIRKIIDITKEKKREEYLVWDILLTPHHCSKKVMYWKDEGQDEEEYKKDIMDDFENYSKEDAYIVASCESDFSDEEGKNPPHLKVRKRYEEIIDPGNFLCTHEYPDQEKPEPIIFKLNENGFQTPDVTSSKAKDVASAIASARGADSPPKQQVGFGKTC